MQVANEFVRDLARVGSVERFCTLNDILKFLFKSKTVWDYDDRYTCPMFGYKDHEHFYDDAAVEFLPLKDISVPVLAFNADDDPMCRRKGKTDLY